MGEPTGRGRFGEFGGRFVPETLVPACEELEAAFRDAWNDDSFRQQFDDILRDYAGRPSLLSECHNLGQRVFGYRIADGQVFLQSVDTAAVQQPPRLSYGPPYHVLRVIVVLEDIVARS